MYVSINNSKIVTLLKIYLINGVAVGGNMPDQFIDHPGAQGDIIDILETLHGKDNTKQFTHEVKVMAVLFCTYK